MSKNFFKTLNMIPMPLEIFLLMYVICADHFSLLSMMTLRHCVPFTSCVIVSFIIMWSVQRGKLLA